MKQHASYHSLILFSHSITSFTCRGPPAPHNFRALSDKDMIPIVSSVFKHQGADYNQFCEVRSLFSLSQYIIWHTDTFILFNFVLNIFLNWIYTTDQISGVSNIFFKDVNTFIQHIKLIRHLCFKIFLFQTSAVLWGFLSLQKKSLMVSTLILSVFIQ